MRFPVVTSSKPTLQISCMQSHYQTRPLYQVSETLSKIHIALGKDFAELGKLYMAIVVTSKKALPSAFSRALGKTFAMSVKALSKIK